MTQSNSNPLLSPGDMGVILFISLASAALVYILMSSIGSFVTTSELAFPAELASVASSAATLILVILTGWYTYETRRMAKQQEQQRKIQTTESWYRQVLTEARLLQRTWDIIAKPDNLRDHGYMTERENLEEMTEHIESLLRLYGSCPAGVPDDIRKLIDQLYRDWYFSSIGEFSYLPKDHDARESLDELLKRIRQESEDFQES